ncbi:MAG: hypothetical protein JWM90_250 [Thermoleophilia bacterium]|nr:hypothetical protein [Thermoleophilia bacterium]
MQIAPTMPVAQVFTTAASYAETARTQATALSIVMLDHAVRFTRKAIELSSSVPNGGPATDQLFSGLELLKTARNSETAARTPHLIDARDALRIARDTLLAAAAAAR